MKLWNILLYITFVNEKKTASKIIISNVSSDLKLQSCPKRTILSFRLTNKLFAHALFNTVCNCSQNRFTCSHLQNICSIASCSFPQKEQVTSFSTPMFANTTFVAKIRCASLIWNHLSFISRIFLFLFFVLVCWGGGEGGIFLI